MNICEKELDYFPSLRQLWAKLIENNAKNSIYFYDLYQTFTFGFRHKLLEDKKAAGLSIKFFVLEQDDGAPSGFCSVSYSVEQSEGEIEMLYVDETLRGGGHGTALMNAALECFAQNGIANQRLCVAYGNEKAMGFYQKFGFYQFTTDMLRK